MSVLNPNSDEEPQECPLCMEFLELDDINFYPCSCGYQICRFCWNKIRTEGSGLCPACRSPYSENPADFKPLTAEELAKIKAEKRQKDLAKKQRISENRKHLANVRVVQRNLVFVVGLSPRLADSEVLKKPEYFGRFGKIHKVVINTSTTYAGNQNQQGPSASAYVTYYKSEDALRAIQAVNNVVADGRTLKASLGTTKYCSHFMKNMPCPKHDCMYLHELGDEAASFTKEEMQQGKHTEYEKNLHDELSMSSTVSTHHSATTTSSESSISPATHASSGMRSSMAPSGGPPEPPSSFSSASTVAAVVASTTNGRAASEHSDKLSSRTPSPHQPMMANGGWPNLGLDSNNIKKTRPFDHQRNKSPPSNSSQEGLIDNSINSRQVPLLNGSEDPLSHCGRPTTNSTENILESSNNKKHENCDSSWNQLQQQQQHQQQPPQPPLMEGGSSSIKDHYKADLFEEDDLGFDPFHETQKALAEMLESESKQVAAQQQQQQHHQQPPPHRHLYQHQQSAPPFTHPSRPAANDSPPLQNLRHESPVMNRAPGSILGGLRGFGNEPGLGNHASSGNRVKQPPPGFDPLSLLNNSGTNGQQSTQRNLLSPDAMGLLNLEALSSQLNMNAGFGHHNDLGGSSSGSRHDSGGPGNGFGGHGMMSNHHLHNGMTQGLGLGLKNDIQTSAAAAMRTQSFLMEKQHQQHSKDWQDGLRALLPNVNVSFGALPHGPSTANGTDGRMYSQQSSMLNDHHHPHERMQRHQQQQQQQHQSRSGWNSVKSPHANDWTTLDPAIVSGQVADNLSHNPSGNGGLRADSPPGWLKNSLDQLTGDNMAGGRFSGLNGSGGGPGSAGLISGLAGLGLGGGHHGPQPGIGQWGQPSPVMSNTPPPGFALNRGQMGPMQPPVSQQHQQPHPFPGLAGLGGGNNVGPVGDRDPALESELARLVRS